MYRAIINDSELILKTLLRKVPEKRLVFQGSWGNSAVIVKIFHNNMSAERHWKRDVDGISAFENNDILTPKMLWHGKLPVIDELKLDGTAWGIILEELTDAKSSFEVWLNSSVEEKKNLAGSLVETLALHNKAGLLQTDIHLKNFLLFNGKVYSIDGDGIEALEKISVEQAADNLAFMTVQADPLDQYIFEELIDFYLSLTFYNEDEFRKEFRKAKEMRFNWRCERWVKKVFRNCTDVEFYTSPGRKVWIDNRFNSAELKKYCEDPESLFPKSTDDLLKNGNSATVALVEVNGRKLAVKRYNYNKNLRTFIRRFRTSRGAISWSNAHMLQHFGLNTPDPVALIETYSGPAVKHAYYLSVYTEGRDAHSWFTDMEISIDKKQTVADTFKNILKTFEICKITHGDLKATNFIVTPDDKLSVIDLDAMKRHSSETSYLKARKKDLKRWYKNWQGRPDIARLFDDP